MIQRHVWVTGRVQGVGFRAATAAAVAEKSSVRGFVRNLHDGRVEAIFVGDEPEVLALVAWCSRGPLHAQVNALEVREEAPPDPAPVRFEVLPD